jgi:hypothetical protein
MVVSLEDFGREKWILGIELLILADKEMTPRLLFWFKAWG